MYTHTIRQYEGCKVLVFAGGRNALTWDTCTQRSLALEIITMKALP